MRSENQIKGQGHQASFKPLPGNGKPSKGKHSALSSKSALKISKKIGDSGRKLALVADNGKSFGEKLRMLSSYTFYYGVLQQPSFFAFAHPSTSI